MIIFIDNARWANDKGGMAIDMRSDEYMKQLKELKQALDRFASKHEHKELSETIQKIPDLDYKDYEKIFYAEDYSALGGGIISGAVFAIYMDKIVQLKEYLIETEPALSTCAIYLKATL